MSIQLFVTGKVPPINEAIRRYVLGRVWRPEVNRNASGAKCVKDFLRDVPWGRMGVFVTESKSIVRECSYFIANGAEVAVVSTVEWSR